MMIGRAPLVKTFAETPFSAISRSNWSPESAVRPFFALLNKSKESRMKNKSSSARYSNCKFANWLLVACLLTGSAIATTARAQLTILATGQAGAGNIIVDGSRVYWINTNNAVVSSVDKLNGGVVRIHNPAGINSGPGTYDLVQDNINLYFASAQTPPHFPD